MVGTVARCPEAVNTLHLGRERRLEPPRGRRVGQPPEVAEAPARCLDLGRGRGIKGFLLLLALLKLQSGGALAHKLVNDSTVLDF